MEAATGVGCSYCNNGEKAEPTSIQYISNHRIPICAWCKRQLKNAKRAHVDTESAQLFYEAYGEALKWRNVAGYAIPRWDENTNEAVREGWRAVAKEAYELWGTPPVTAAEPCCDRADPTDHTHVDFSKGAASAAESCSF